MTGNKKLKIALGDLKHKTAGRHSYTVPIGISFIASYLLSKVNPKTIEVKLYYDPDEIIKDITEWKPDILGLSNYCWNTDLSRIVFKHAKEINPSTVCIAGGPNFPNDTEEQKSEMAERPELDFFIRHEGEVVFTDLVKKIQKGESVKSIGSNLQDGIVSLHPETGDLIAGKVAKKLDDLDEIPSPYISGIADKWLDEHLAPSVEMTRGCPFSCGYCFIGQEYFNRLRSFSIKRVKDEMTYIAKKMRKYPDILLTICDSNFGMTERDEEIAAHIGKLQDKYGWPNAFELTTGKRNYNRIMKISRLLHNKMYITNSFQSLNPDTLKVIKRKNLSLEEFKAINKETKKHGMRSATELIVPMPEETKDSFFEGVKKVIDVVNPDFIIPYTTMLLKGTYLASKECRQKYKMQTKFRILPKQFGEYLGEKCFEIEEVCVATNTMSFNDYIEVRGFSLISSFFSMEQFDVIYKHLKELNLNKYDYIKYIWDLINSGETELFKIYDQFIKETKDELWDSKDELLSYFNKKENYEKLLSGELGDNLLRKYQTKFLLEKCVESIELAYSVINTLAGKDLSSDIRDSLNAAKKWMISTRDVSSVFKKSPYLNAKESLELPFDVNAWYLAGADSKPLLSYKSNISYMLFCDTGKLKMIFNEMEKLYGGDLLFQISQMVKNWGARHFWRKCMSDEKVKV